MESEGRITRREALRQVAILLGGAVSAPTVAGVLDAATRRAWADAEGWEPRTLSPDQLELVATIAEHVIPQTDTPGARAAGVHRFVDTLLTDHYREAERDRFLVGLERMDAQAQSRHGMSFVRCPPGQRVALLTELDRAAYPPAGADAEPAPPAAWFFRRMKELTLAGYYTSEIGAARELRVAPLFTVYHGDIPYRSVGRAWS
jgi:hypothetical protein